MPICKTKKKVKKDKFARQQVFKMTNLYDLPGLPYPKFKNHVHVLQFEPTSCVFK